MGIGVSLILVAAGAILVWGVNGDIGSVNEDAIGWILMIVGIVGLLLSLLWWERFGPGSLGWHRGPGPYGPGPGARTGRRRTVIEDDVPPPAGPPPGAPPP